MPETEGRVTDLSMNIKTEHWLCTNLIPISSLGGTVGVADIIIGIKGRALGRGTHELNRAVLVCFATTHLRLRILTK